jgi:hypothetical protein
MSSTNNKMNLKVPKSSIKHIRKTLKVISELYSNIDYDELCERLTENTTLEINYREPIDYTKILKKFNKNQLIKLLIKLNMTNNTIYDKTTKKDDLVKLFDDVSLEDLGDDLINGILECNKKIKDLLIEKLNNMTFNEEEKEELNESEIKKIDVNTLKTTFEKLIEKYDLKVKTNDFNKEGLINLYLQYFKERELTETDILKYKKVKKEKTKKTTGKRKGKSKKPETETTEIVNEVEEEKEEEKPKPKQKRKTKKVVKEEETEEKKEDVKPSRRGRRKRTTNKEIQDVVDEL